VVFSLSALLVYTRVVNNKHTTKWRPLTGDVRPLQLSHADCYMLSITSKPRQLGSFSITNTSVRSILGHPCGWLPLSDTRMAGSGTGSFIRRSGWLASSFLRPQLKRPTLIFPLETSPFKSSSLVLAPKATQVDYIAAPPVDLKSEIQLTFSP
jgi:hypothetical protein